MNRRFEKLVASFDVHDYYRLSKDNTQIVVIRYINRYTDLFRVDRIDCKGYLIEAKTVTGLNKAFEVMDDMMPML